MCHRRPPRPRRLHHLRKAKNKHPKRPVTSYKLQECVWDPIAIYITPFYSLLARTECHLAEEGTRVYSSKCVSRLDDDVNFTV